MWFHPLIVLLLLFAIAVPEEQKKKIGVKELAEVIDALHKMENSVQVCDNITAPRNWYKFKIFILHICCDFCVICTYMVLLICVSALILSLTPLQLHYSLGFRLSFIGSKTVN